MVEAVAEIVGGVGGDDKRLSVLLRDERGEAAGGGGLADAALAAHEDPSQGLLVQDVLECSCEFALHLLLSHDMR